MFSENPTALAKFYEKVFGKALWSDHGYHGFQVGNGHIIIGPHDKVHGKSKNPERIMINLETNDVKGEFERVKGLGVTVVAAPYNPGEEPEGTIATLADPDGNYFQLMSPMGEPEKKN